MAINPVWFGVAATLAAEFVLTIIVVAVIALRTGKAADKLIGKKRNG